MSLKELQQKMLINSAKKHFIKQGKPPTSKEVADYINEKLKDTIPGLPLFKAIYGEKYEVASKNDFNSMIQTIHEDLTNLYNADNHVNNEILSLFNLYENEKRNCINALSVLQKNLDSAIYMMENKDVKFAISDVFDTFEHIDFVGNEDKNIPETTSFINLLSKYAASDIKFSNIIDITSADINFTIENKPISNVRLSAIENCINNNVAETWLQKIILDTNGELRCSLELTLPEEQVINTISIDLSSPRKLKIACTLYKDEQSSTQLISKESYDECEWNFKNTPVKKIVFNITKSEHDDTDGVNFIYYIGVKKISLYKHVYQKESVFVSTPYDIEAPFSQVVLTEDASVPQQTVIKSYIGIENDKSTSWIKLNSEEESELNLLATNNEHISRTSVGYGAQYNDDLYVIAELLHVPVQKSLQLDIGMNMWEVREIPFNESTPLKEVYYQEPTKYIEATTIKFDVAPKTVQMISINVISEETLNLQTTIMCDGGLSRYIFVNGTTAEGTQEDGTYNIRLARGLNKINVLAINKEDEQLTYIFDAYFKDLSARVIANTNSTQIDIHDMIYNTPKNTYTKYAIADNKIVVNYDPREFGMKYDCAYCYDKFNIFDNAKIRFMSVFESELDQITAKLYGYKLALLAKPTTDIGDENGGLYDGMYIVMFVDYNGELLKKEYVMEGFGATAPADPYRDGFMFIGWDKAFDDIRSNLTVVALYDTAKYIVVFKNWDGTVLSTQYIEYGEDAVLPPTPDGPNSIEIPESKHNFVGWSESHKSITYDKVIYAMFDNSEAIKCTFVDWDGSDIEDKYVLSGQTIIPPNEPEREGYEFIGWNIDGLGHQVEFIDWDGTVLDVQDILHGETVTPPNDPERIEYEFIGWEIDT